MRRPLLLLIVFTRQCVPLHFGKVNNRLHRVIPLRDLLFFIQLAEMKFYSNFLSCLHSYYAPNSSGCWFYVYVLYPLFRVSFLIKYLFRHRHILQIYFHFDKSFRPEHAHNSNVFVENRSCSFNK